MMVYARTKASDQGDVRWFYRNSYWLVIIVLLCSLISAAPAASAEQSKPVENLLAGYNPDFEDVSAQSGIAGWTVSHGDVGIVGDDSHLGKHSLFISSPTAKLYSNNIIKVEPGYEYHMAVWGKFKNVQFIDKGYYGVGFGLEEQNSDRVINGDWYFMSMYLAYKEGDLGWTRTEIVILPKETTVYLRPFLLVWVLPGGEVWFDNVQVWNVKKEDVRVDTMVNVISNGSFEIRHELGMDIANDFAAIAPKGLEKVYEKRMAAVEETKYHGTASMKITGECAVGSLKSACDARSTVAQVAVKTVNVGGADAYAKLVFYDKNHKPVGTRKIAGLRGSSDWKVYKAGLKSMNRNAYYVQWVFGMGKGASGVAYFDDLQFNVPSSVQTLAHRPKNTEHATVRVDCSTRGGVFESPLCAYHTGGAHIAYSPTMGTAGKYVDGPGRWHSEARRLGFKYVRIGPWCLNPHLAEMRATGKDQWKVSFDEEVVDNNGKPFGPASWQDQQGKVHCDISAFKYILDNAVLKGGLKPLVDFSQVPAWLAKNGDTRCIPTDWKKWEELCYMFVKALVDVYGRDEVKTWIFETCNEPGNPSMFVGDPDNPTNCENDLIKMQDYAYAGAVRVLPEIFLAGPSGRATSALVDHCATGRNYATGQVGCKIDAISGHFYWAGSVGDLSWRTTENAMLNFQKMARSYYDKTGKTLQVFDTEFAPIAMDGNVDLNNIPHARNNHISAIAVMHHGYLARKLGLSLVTFFHEAPVYKVFFPGVPHDKVPEFCGYNTCITFHGIFKPVCRAVQMMSMLNDGIEVKAEADNEPIWALASVADNQIRVLCYNLEADTKAAYTTQVDMVVDCAGMPGKTFKATRYDMSATKANSWYLARQMNLTQADCDKDITIVDRINRESELKPEDTGVVAAENGKLNVRFDLPAFSAVLYVFERVGEGVGQ